jgi:hypothetical protein
MNKLNSKKTKAIAIFLLIFGITAFKLIQRENYSSNEKIDFCTNETVTIFYQYSNYKWYGTFHSGIGLENPIYILKFTFKKKDYLYISNFNPIVLNCFNSTIYIIAFDRFTNFPKIFFRYYKYDKKWIEIESRDFPKSVAIQNIGLEKENGFINGKAVNEYEICSELDTSFGPFQNSITAKIWFELGTGTKYYEAPDRINGDYLQKFKIKYIPANIYSKKKPIKINLRSGSDTIMGGTSASLANSGIVSTCTYFDQAYFYYFLKLVVFLLITIFSIKFLCGRLIKNATDPNKAMRIKDFQHLLIFASIVFFVYLILFDFIAAWVDFIFL